MNRRGFLRSAAVTISVMALAALIKGTRQWWVPEGFRPADYDEWGVSTENFIAAGRHLGKTNMRYEYMHYLINKS